jgi:hypothetical protein
MISASSFLTDRRRMYWGMASAMISAVKLILNAIGVILSRLGPPVTEIKLCRMKEPKAKPNAIVRRL